MHTNVKLCSDVCTLQVRTSERDGIRTAVGFFPRDSQTSRIVVIAAENVSVWIYRINACKNISSTAAGQKLSYCCVHVFINRFSTRLWFTVYDHGRIRRRVASIHVEKNIKKNYMIFKSQNPIRTAQCFILKTYNIIHLFSFISYSFA